ncbi:MAG: hypothetical protein AB7O62_07300 [Pirellulales bacterium]
MAIDSPARIAVLGAGPVGLETALYARFLGYEVAVYERGRVAENVLRWGHARMFSPFGQNRSALGLAALAAQDQSWQPPADDALLTGNEWVASYLGPLSQSDLLADSIRERTTVLAIGRDGLLRDDCEDRELRGEPDLRLLIEDADGERFETADAVIDATGNLGNPLWLGPGGLPAIGEREHRERIEYGLPDILGRDRPHYAGQRILVVGNGIFAAMNIVNLAELARAAPDTRVTWLTRAADGVESPVQIIENDPLPARRELAAAANRLAADSQSPIAHWSGAAVERIRWKADAQRFSVRLLNAPEEKLKVDRLVANVGWLPDNSLFRELRVQEIPASGTAPTTADSLLQPEPDFYILGTKSQGRHPQFLFSNALEQIRQLFTIIGDRPELNLYATIGGVPRR